MKRSILIFVSLFVLLSYVMAEPVDSTRALQVAKQFIPQYSSSAKKVPKKGTATGYADIVYTHKMPKSGRDAFYIVNVGDAFVMVSADDIAHQILGYSFDKGFPVAADGTVQLPPHIKGFFDDLAAQMEAATEAEPNRAASEEWSGARRVHHAPSNLPESIGPLLTTTWDQGQYYNALCPEDENGPAGHVWTGCVATAMAQIIKYWGEPVHGRGIHSYESNYGILEVNFAESNYDFDNMPDALSGESTAEQVNAVAKLMYDCGVAVNMDYTSSESAAFDQETRTGLINFFRFSPDLSFAEKAYFSNEEWNNLLRQNLAANQPVYYSGQGTGGHAFVCDGYKADDYYHFNFGWGGFADGWFLTSAVTPNDREYNSSQSAIVGIVPDNTGNVILGQMLGTSTFVVDEPLEFYHLMGHNKYEGSNYNNPCNSTVTFIPADDSKQMVADILEFENQNIQIFDGTDTNNSLRSLYGGGENDLSPVVSSARAITLTYSGNFSYDGFKLIVSQEDECRMVSNISYSVDATKIQLSWLENGSATHWDVEYGVKGFELGSGTLLAANETKITIEGLTTYKEYDFYIRPQCGGSWYGPITLMTLAPYWIDVVTTQPAGYSIDSEGNVTISSAEGLAWWAKLSDNQYRYWRWMVYQEPFVPTIDDLSIIDLENAWYYSCPTTIIADIDLDGYRWKPVSYHADIDGRMHTISNMLIYEDASLEPEPYYGFLSSFSGPSQVGYTIKNIVFQDPVINCPMGYYGVLAGGTLSANIKNIGVNNAVINQYSSSPFNSIYNVYGVAGGGLIGHAELTNIDNCYSTGSIVSEYPYPNINNGGIVGYAENLSAINNCYSSLQIQSQTGGLGSICSYANGLEMRNCYGADYHYPILGQNDLTIDEFRDTLQFDKNTQQLNGSVYFDEESCNTLFEALNLRVTYENSETWMTWQTDDNNVNNGFPILSTPYIVTCPNTENIVATNVIINNQNALSLTWDNNEEVSYWRIKCIEKDAPDNLAHYYMTEKNSINITDLMLAKIYRIYVKPICDETHQGGWGAGIQHVYEKPYWTDFVTAQPEGFIIDDVGNVTITSREGFVWLSCLVNGLHGQEYQSFRGKQIHLMTDVDLSQYRWMPIGNTWWNQFEGSFDGGCHTINNVYVNEYHDWVGLFGHVFQSQIIGIKLENSTISGYSNVGAICGFYQNNDGWWDVWNYGPVMFDNCRIINTSVYGDQLVGTLVGRVENWIETTITNCSASGEVHGSCHVGGLIGNIKDYSKVANCYSMCDVYSTQMDCGGLIGFTKDCVIENSYATGTITSIGGSYGKLVGYLCDNITCNYLYGFEDKSMINLFGYIGSDCTIANSDWFTSAGAINNAVTIDGTAYTDLVSALNAWVDANNSEGLYRHWVKDKENVNGGFPFFAPTYTLTYKVDGEIYKTNWLEAGVALPAVEEPTKDGYVFGGWSETPETMPDHDVEITGSFYLYGDVNTDTKVNVVDVVDIARYVVDTPSENFREKLADLNSDLSVNIADAVVLVNHIAGDQNFVKAELPISSFNDYESCSLGLQYGEMNDLSLCLTGNMDFTAFQFEIDVPEGMDISAMHINGLRKDGHQLLFNKVGAKRYRVAALSLSNAVFKGNDGELLNISLEGIGSDDICIHDIHFITTKGTDIVFDSLRINGAETGIADIHDEGNRPVYDLQGRRRSTLQRGVNIVCGKKMIVR